MLEMSTEPLISVLTPVYNTDADVLEECVASVVGQTYRNWQLCLVDDRSPEPHVWPLLQDIATRDPRIFVGRRDVNGGIVAASNDCAALATGDVVSLLDHDDLLAPTALAEVAAAFAAHDDVDYVYSDEDIVDLVKHNARSFLFSASLPVPIVAAASTILDMLEADGPAMVAELHQKSEYMRAGLAKIGFDLGKSDTHIMPVMCKDERKTLFMHIALLECGVLMVPLTYPSVKQGEERLRVNVTRGHTQEDIDTALSLLAEYGEAFFVLSGEDLGPLEE